MAGQVQEANLTTRSARKKLKNLIGTRSSPIRPRWVRGPTFVNLLTDGSHDIAQSSERWCRSKGLKLADQVTRWRIPHYDRAL
jgi:hypothetical protein